jgi:hypothetical protein
MLTHNAPPCCRCLDEANESEAKQKEVLTTPSKLLIIRDLLQRPERFWGKKRK